MHHHKRIEDCLAPFIAERYRCAVEVGIGRNFAVAEKLIASGVRLKCIDLKPICLSPAIEVIEDDIFAPNELHYNGAELIYSIRPGVEMIPPLIRIARKVDADLLVYHLGGEMYGNGGRIVDCGVILHQYHARSKN